MIFIMPVLFIASLPSRSDQAIDQAGSGENRHLGRPLGRLRAIDGQARARASARTVKSARNLQNRLCRWFRFYQHAVGKGLCIGGEAEERAESIVAGFAAVEAKDDLIEIGLQMLAVQPVVDASRPSFEVGEDLVDPRQDEVSGGLPDDMDGWPRRCPPGPTTGYARARPCWRTACGRAARRCDKSR